MSDVVVKMIL